VTDTLGYIRVSTDQQATEQKTSLADQRRSIIDFAAKLGRVLDPSSIFEDAGFSGATAEGRPAFMELYRYCEANARAANRRGMIIILNDSRFGRFDDPEEASHHRYVLKQLGWIVRFAEADDVEDPLGRSLIRVVHSAQASAYRSALRIRAKQAARSNAALGRWQQEAPFGYRRLATRADGQQRVLAIAQRKSADEVSRLTLGPDEEVAAVRWMYETYAKGGLSTRSMAREMEKRFPKRAKWSNVTCRQILHNPAYVGDIVWCRRVTDKTERLERTVRDVSEWVIVKDAHAAIVSRELAETVRLRFVSNKRQTTATQGGYPLSGVIRCKQCGNHFAGGGGKRGPADDVDRYRFYRDTGNGKREPECGPPMVTLRKRWIENVVIDVIAEFVAKPETQETIRTEMSRILREAKSDNRGRRTQLEKDREQLLRQRKRLVDAIAAGTVTESEAATNLAEVRSRIASTDSEIERLRFAGRATESMGEEIERMVKAAQDFPTEVRRLKGVALRETLTPWILSAVVDKETRYLELTLCRIPEAMKVLRLGNSRARGTQDHTIDRRLTARRRIPIPRQQVQLTGWCKSRRRARA
jgi:DNA invertase Pin-like site-specific DNA recombinase